MNKNFKMLMSVICLLAILLSVSACDSEKENENTEAQYHTITFNTNGGTPIESLTVKHGTHAHAPQNPTLENYVFCRWQLDGQAWFFDAKLVTKDITLDALWISAESLFDITPIGDGLGITKIKDQKNFEYLLVPSVINGKPVVAVLDGAFESVHNQHGQNIVFPEGITAVGAESFKNVTEPTLEFKGAITSIGEAAFENCKSLPKITLGSGMESIPFRAFTGCTGLKTIIIPSGVKTIEENAFEGCSSMLTVVLPASLEFIENSAFDDTAIISVFFMGTEQQFDAVEIAEGNDKIVDANIYYYSEEKPSQSDIYWHYDSNGSPIIW